MSCLLTRRSAVQFLAPPLSHVQVSLGKILNSKWPPKSCTSNLCDIWPPSVCGLECKSCVNDQKTKKLLCKSSPFATLILYSINKVRIRI